LSEPADLQALLDDLSRMRPRIIGVDGELGAGKTTLAMRIAERLNCRHIHVDSFLIKGRSSFLPSIRYERLAQALCGPAPVVIEGICLLAVLERLSVSADWLIFVDGGPPLPGARPSPLLVDELRSYVRSYSPRSKAHRILTRERLPMTNSFDVDIAHIRAKTAISIVLAAGGLIQTLCGALLVNAGLGQQGAASLRVMGAEVSATGLGGIILTTSVLWAYIAFLARPQGRTKTESRTSTRRDGTIDVYELRTSTQTAAAPEPAPRESTRSATQVFVDPSAVRR
jgi:hypothetical protein